MVDCHGSQCGFCTPGFVMSLWACYERHQARARCPRGSSWPTTSRATCAAAPATGRSSTPASGCSSCRAAAARHGTGGGGAAAVAGRPAAAHARRLPCAAHAGRVRGAARGTAQTRGCSPAAPTWACGSRSSSATWATLISIGEVDELQRIDDRRRRAAHRRRRLAGSRLAGAGRALAGAARRVAALRVAADPPGRHDGRQRRQRLADRRRGAGADGAGRGASCCARRRGAQPAARRLLRRLHEEPAAARRVRAARCACRCPIRRAGHAVRAYKISKRFDCDISAVCAGLALQLDGGTVRRRALRLRRHGRHRAPCRAGRGRGARPAVDRGHRAGRDGRAGTRLHAADRHARQRRATGCRWRRTCCSGCWLETRADAPLPESRRQRLAPAEVPRMNSPADLPLQRTPAPRGRRRGAARVGGAARGRRRALHRRPARTGRHAARGAGPVAAGARRAARHRPRRACAPLPGVVDVFTAQDIPGPNDCGALVHDDPILAGEPGATLRYLGQPVFAVIATTREAARRAAALAQAGDRRRRAAAGADAAAGARGAAVRGAADAPGARRRARRHRRRAAPLHDPLRRRRPGAVLPGRPDLATRCRAKPAACSSSAPPSTPARCSTWWRTRCSGRRTRCRWSAGAWAAASAARNRSRRCSPASPRWRRRGCSGPVKLRVDRDDDFLITGRRHCFHYDIEVGHDDDGRILGAEVTMVSRAGHSADLSGPVMTRALCHFDNAYWLPHVAMHGYRGKTNTQSNTAFRGFGGPQGAIAIEAVLDSVARRLGLDPLEVRRANFYGEHSNNVTPYGQTVDDNILRAAGRRAGAQQRLRRAPRRGGRVQRRQPGAEEGPGADAAEVRHQLQRRAPEPGRRAGARLHRRQRAREPRRHRDGPGPEHQGGAGGGAGTGPAASAAVRVQRHRHAQGRQHLAPPRPAPAATSTARRRRTRRGRSASGWPPSPRRPWRRAPTRCIRDGQVRPAARRWPLPSWWTRPTWRACSCGATASTPRPACSWDRQTMQGRPFYYFAYGAAVSEVLVDTLTGEWKLLRADVLHDVGHAR